MLDKLLPIITAPDNWYAICAVRQSDVTYFKNLPQSVTELPPEKAVDKMSWVQSAFNQDMGVLPLGGRQFAVMHVYTGMAGGGGHRPDTCDTKDSLAVELYGNGDDLHINHMSVSVVIPGHLMDKLPAPTRYVAPDSFRIPLTVFRHNTQRPAA